MADLSELLKSKKVSTFVRKEKSRPWTIERTPAADSGQEAPKPVKTELKPGENPVKTELKPGENPVTPKPPKNLKNTKPGENPVNNPVKLSLVVVVS